jgi:hypothetical protein
VVAASLAALTAALVYLIATRNDLGSWVLTLALPILVLYGVVRRRIAGRSTAASVRPAVQGLNEVQDVVLNRPGIAVTYGSPVRDVAAQHEPRSPDPLLDVPDPRRDRSSERD